MRALKILQQSLSYFLVSIHRKRVTTIFWAVQCLLLGNRLSLTGIGRASRQSSKIKHAIKRMDRLLGNRNLHKEANLFFHAIAMTLLGATKRPVILIDWTTVGPVHEAIVAAVASCGRALPLYAEVHDVKNHNTRKVHCAFLKNLREILPVNCTPIIVTDAGFKTPWFKDVIGLGWDYVGRVMGTAQARQAGVEDWLSIKNIYSFAKRNTRDLGPCFLTLNNQFETRLVLAKQTRRKTTVFGGTRARKSRVRFNNPWLLATSLRTENTEQIIALYATRMQIEETFRDAKSHRFGWSMVHAQSTTCDRIRMLLLIAILGIIALTLLGKAAESQKLHLDYQANRTTRKRRVLSLFFLGRNILLAGNDVLISMPVLWRILLSLESNLIALAVDNEGFCGDP